MRLEGLPRQASTHACGIIIAKEPVVNYVPLYARDGVLETQYIMTTLEELGLLKMDFLGLTNLTTIFACLNSLNHKGINIPFDSIPYKEKEIFDLICTEQTMGVFQIESSGMKKAIKILQPNCFEDIVALLALFRPGPMDSIQSYARRKAGKEKINYYSEYKTKIVRFRTKNSDFVFQPVVKQHSYNEFRFASVHLLRLSERLVIKRDVLRKHLL